MSLFSGLRHDAAYALRSLRKSPSFTVVAVLTLALGIGANTAIFSVVRGVLLRPLPFRDPEQLVMIASTYDGHRAPSSPANIFDWRDQNRSFSAMTVLDGHSVVLTGAGEPERLRGFDVSADFFGVLGVNALLGRSTFTPEEAAWRGKKAVILNETLWRTRFGGDPRLVGAMITLDNERYEVVGIVPASSAWPTASVLWLPFSMDPKEIPTSRGAVFLNVVARLKPGATVVSASADMSAIASRLALQYPDMDKHVGTMVVPMREWITGDLRRPLLVLLGGVAFVLLIACANVANLLLVRGVAREGELAVRTALGAGRGRLVRQLVTESLVLSMLGGAAGLGLAYWGTSLLVSAAPASIPRLAQIHVDGLVLAFTLVIAVASGLLFGLVPARQMVQADIAHSLREGSRGVAQRVSSQRARRALVVAEVALSVMLLSGAGLLIRSFRALTEVDPGFRTDHAVSFALSLPDTKYNTGDKDVALMNALMVRLRAIPGVQGAGATLALPLTSFHWQFEFSVAGRPPLSPSDRPVAEVRMITPDYLATMGIPVRKGRAFTAEDRSGGAKVIMLTEAAAERFFPGEDPIGKHVTFGLRGDQGTLEGDIVGITADVKQYSLAEPAAPQFWVPYFQWPITSFVAVLRGARDPQMMVADARRAVHDLDADLAVAQVRTLDQVLTESVAQPRFYMLLLAAFAAVAIALSAIGIYGVIAYLVGQRAREIGIRLALGASAGSVVRLVVRESVVVSVAGIVIGLGGAFAITRLMRALLFSVTPTDPATYLTVTMLLAATALAASAVPAMRAARVDPALAMRSE